ncbi:peptidoglycan-binding domain-containing protein [Candidatus Entotheonella palauensis]|uniref:Peptidoglycan binding-like domain-containing protein n=1 Tax=Candidatus Entotheonella gemina TaxID=1429439 RepID=W4MBP5_9BACT|nr:peptidoglycan-binding protein [Candidatus Entotheonella palauensis]ETX07633.1 MAG: hypothetical protein ETSY2_10100 [Candidatus Entotheonella gemina]
MSPISKKVFGASLIVAGIAGFSGCASKDADILSLERQLAAKQARIEELETLKADMQRVIDLKNADLERQRKGVMQAGHRRGMGYAAECYVRVLSPPTSKTDTKNITWHPVLCHTQTTPEIVRQIQRALKQARYYHAAVDGIYGPQTRRAVKSYQRAKGLAVGGLTFETLKSLGLKSHDQQVVAGTQ